MTGGLVVTIILAAVVMAAVVAGLAIGFLLTGKSRLRRGCGKSPANPDKSCSLCHNKKTCISDEEEKDS